METVTGRSENLRTQMGINNPKGNASPITPLACGGDELSISPKWRCHRSGLDELLDLREWFDAVQCEHYCDPTPVTRHRWSMEIGLKSPRMPQGGTVLLRVSEFADLVGIQPPPSEFHLDPRSEPALVPKASGHGYLPPAPAPLLRLVEHGRLVRVDSCSRPSTSAGTHRSTV